MVGRSESIEDFESIFSTSFRRSIRIYTVCASLLSVVGGLFISGRTASILGVVFTAGLFTLPGILLYTKVSRKCHPDQLHFWRGATIGLKLLYMWGFAIATIIISEKIALYEPRWSMFWVWMRFAVVVYEVGMFVIWRWRLRDVLKEDIGLWKSVIVGTDILQAFFLALLPLTLVFGPKAIPFWREFWGPGRIISVGLGVASICAWSAASIDFLSTKSGILSLGVDLANLGVIVIAFSGPIAIFLTSLGGVPSDNWWIIVPSACFASILPGAFSASAIALFRLAPGNKRLVKVTMGMYFFAFSGSLFVIYNLTQTHPLPVWATNLAGCILFGPVVVLPTIEGIDSPQGLERLSPHEQVRKRTPIPIITAVALGAILLPAYLFRGRNNFEVSLSLFFVATILVLFTIRHLAAIRETKHLYRQLESANEELFDLSRADSLTGLSNRRALFEGLNQLTAQAKRSQLPLSLILIDIDHFKAYNDKYGHVVGDQVLRRLAAIMYTNIREIDLAARYGGEEFCIALPSTDHEGAFQLSEKLRKTCEEIQGDHKFTFSSGVALWDGIEPIESLLSRADKALYMAKAAGRNCTKTIVKNYQNVPIFTLNT